MLAHAVDLCQREHDALRARVPRDAQHHPTRGRTSRKIEPLSHVQVVAAEHDDARVRRDQEAQRTQRKGETIEALPRKAFVVRRA